LSFSRLPVFFAALAAGLLVHAAPGAAQLAVEPLFLEVAPGQSVAIRARNTSEKPMTLELEIARRHVDKDGVQTRTAADDDFIAIPPQAVVPPLGSQVFRLQSLPTGGPESRSYFVTVHQLPVKLGEIEGGGAQLQMVFAFDVAVHTVPPGAEAKPQIVSAALSQTTVAPPKAETEGGAPDQSETKDRIAVPAVEVTLRNAGTKYVYLQNLEFIATGVDAAGSKVDLPRWDQNEIIDAAGVTLVEPGAERIFKLPLRHAPALKSVSVEVRQRPQL
jgi:fimbrial chaperone protein